MSSRKMFRGLGNINLLFNISSRFSEKKLVFFTGAVKLWKNKVQNE